MNTGAEAGGYPPVGRAKVALETAVTPIPSPRRELEQYTTPADIAVRIAVDALLRGLLEGARAADLAAGTCRLGLALLLYGAFSVAAVEADERLGRLCLEAAERLGLGGRLFFVASRVSRRGGPLCVGCVDIVVTNPPFGVWRRGADWEVLEHALLLKPKAVYAIVKSGNLRYHGLRAARLGYSTLLISKEQFPIPASMPGHRSRVRRVSVDVILFSRVG
ncbi:METTL5 family protein [Aeropyrum camini]|uniref:Predicted RNA methylase n=1 Tax=Aeropyrum camini SY1 = JCM 12091 TaxID=1198449 RepID=U3TCN1_9CREN|nr:METTL5 family protein [Aeropyrum camini]BAN89795.1 predicted RNA methylase [Aeropyrum camini SY1 = JCM 12091]